jgi:16S rRNA (uracil1498-N3)-methyltransferase
LNLLILTEDDRDDGEIFVLSGNRLRHIIGVLRASVGDRLEVGLVDGPVGKGIVRAIEKERLVLECEWLGDVQDTGPAIDIICALPRPQTFKKVLQVSATMGVRRVYFVNANRVDKCFFSASVTRPETIRYYLEKGLSQGKRTRLPEVSINPRFRCFFEEVVGRLESEEQGRFVKLVADVQCESYLNGSMLEGAARIIIAIGPEGGWVPFELEIMQAQGFEKFKLGDWPLRVENALVATLAQVSLVSRK